MPQEHQISPREEAIKAILRAHGKLADPLTSDVAWEKMIDLAWDNRTHDADRAQIQRELRQILLDASRGTV